MNINEKHEDWKDVAEGSLRDVVEGVEGSVRAGREKLAEGFDRGSKMVLQGAEALEGRAAAASAGLSRGADSLRHTVERNPLLLLGVAAVVGALVGRAIWPAKSGAPVANRSDC